MLEMDDKIARLDVGKEDLGATLLCFWRAAPGLRLAPAKEFGVGVEVEIEDWGLEIGDCGFGRRAPLSVPAFDLHAAHDKALAVDALHQGDAAGRGRGQHVALHVGRSILASFEQALGCAQPGG